MKTPINARPDARPNARPDPLPNARPETQLDPRPDPRPEAQPDARDFARYLIALEAAADPPSGSDHPPARRVYQRLRLSLGEIAGAAAFRAFACRALALARSQSPGLGALRIAASGALEGMEPENPHPPLPESQFDRTAERASERLAADDPPGEGGVCLIASLLTLLLAFLGEALMLSLLRDMWPGADFEDRISLNWRKQ